MMRPLADHRDPKAIDESTDTYDTVAWLLKNVPGNNGRVGVVGTSYHGFLAMMAGIDPHPAVKAISPQAPMIDVWIGDDFFHNGAFRQSYGYDYVLGDGIEQGIHQRQLRQRRKTASPSTASTISSSAEALPSDVKAVRLRNCCPRGSSSSIIRPTTRPGPRAPSNITSTRSPCPHSPSAATTTRRICTARRRSTRTLEPHDSKSREFSRLGPWRHGYWSSSRVAARQSQLRRAHRHRVPLAHRSAVLRSLSQGRARLRSSKTPPASRPDRTRGSTTRTSRRRSRAPQASTSRAQACSAGTRQHCAATASYISDPANPVPYRHRPIQPTYVRRLAVVQLAHRRSALRHWPQRRRRVEAARAHAGSDRHRRSRRRHLRCHHRRPTTTWWSS